MSRRVTVFDCLEVVAKERGWRIPMLYTNLDPMAGEIIEFVEFNRILLLSGLTSDRRKVREVWTYLIDWGIATDVSGQRSKIVVNLSKLRGILGKAYPAYRDAEVSQTKQHPAPAPAPASALDLSPNDKDTEATI